ncbi:hypothetical protein GCM10008967_37520 [Bacillus carboniphilus]|uniref:Uncharacterized protein n=1 Tax=Bacillus carboniphilus TaxID=86663 RepID=A0ABP3GEK3_9BACI
MRVGYSILRELELGNQPRSTDYGLSQREFENFIFFLEQKGYLERVLWTNDKFSLKPSRLTEKGFMLLEENRHYNETYPERSRLKEWIQVEKDQYSNGADHN